MTKIKLNTSEYEVFTYVKNTTLNNGTIGTTAVCSIATNDKAGLEALLSETISSIQIYVDQTLIYDLQNISAKIETISEFLDVDKMSTTLSLTFNT